MTKAIAEQAVEAAASAFVKQVNWWVGTHHCDTCMASFDSDKGSDDSGDEASEAADDQGLETDSGANDSDGADGVVRDGGR